MVPRNGSQESQLDKAISEYRQADINELIEQCKEVA